MCIRNNVTHIQYVEDFEIVLRSGSSNSFLCFAERGFKNASVSKQNIFKKFWYYLSSLLLVNMNNCPGVWYNIFEERSKTD